MIGILNRTILLDGLKLSRYYKLSSNFVHHSAWNSTSLIKPLSFNKREMCKYVKPISPKALKLQTSDGVPLNYDLIYTSFEYHTVSQYVSATIPIVSLVCGTVQCLIDIEVLFPDPWTAALHLWMLALLLYLNCGTAVISYKSPVRIYHNKETGDYKAVFNGLLPSSENRILEFKKGMVEQIPPPDFLTYFRDCRYKIKGQDLYMFDTFFRYPGDLYSMFDKIENECTDEEE